MKVCLLFLCLLFPLSGLGAKPYTPRRMDPVLEPWRWHEMSELNGPGALCVDEAVDGTLWFGAVGGIFEYDGLEVHWIPFDRAFRADTGAAFARIPWCTSVLCLPDGRLLAVVDSALFVLEDGTWEMVLEKQGRPDYSTRLVLDSDGGVWLLGTYTLRRFSEDLSHHEVVFEVSRKERLTSFCFDDSGNIWLVRSRPFKGVESIRIPVIEGRVLAETQWATFPIDDEQPGRESGICAGPDGRIWYVDNHGANSVRSFDSRTRVWLPADLPSVNKGYFYIFRDRRNTLWASGTGWLLAVDKASFKYFSGPDLGLPSVPFSIFETAEGIWWVITRGGHIYRMDPGFDQWTTYVGLQFECETPDGIQWFRTENNLAVSYDQETERWLEYDGPEGRLDSLQSIHVTSSGQVFAVGIYENRAAISLFNGRKWQRSSYPDFATAIYRDGVWEAKDGKIWVGASGVRLPAPEGKGGALCLDIKDGKPKVVKHHGLPNFPYVVSRLTQTPDGTLWLGSPRIHKYKPGEDEGADLVGHIPDLFTLDMAVDERGALWVAKGVFGLYRRMGDEWEQFSTDEHLGGNLAVDLLPLEDGTLLVALDEGISRFDGTTWAKFVLGDDFGMAHRQGSIRESTDGAFWFNFTAQDPRSPRVLMNLGLADRFCTVRYNADSNPPDTMIDDHLEHLDSAGNLHMSWTGRDVWFNTPADELSFSWRLDGGAWSPFLQEKGRRFSSLKSGRHELEVRARDHDFNIDPTPAKTFFTVALPLWQRPWFIFLVFSSIGGAVAIAWILIYYHDKQLKTRAIHLEEMDQVKSSFYTNLSHELRTPLSVMQGPIDHLLELETDEIKRRFLNMIRRSSDRVSNLVGQLLDFRKLEQGKMTMNCSEDDFAVYVKEAVELLQPMAHMQKVTCILALEEPCLGLVDPDKLKKIVTNLVSNAIKYTSEGGRIEIRLRSSSEKQRVELVVEDDGAGIEQKHLEYVFDRFYRASEESMIEGSGIGLNLTKELVELWGGTIWAVSPAHEDVDHPGARFTVQLPLH